MIRKFNSTDINEIMKIWLDSNINVHNFVSEKYWNENYDSVKESIINAEVYVYVDKKSNEILGFIGLIDTYVDGDTNENECRMEWSSN